MSIVSIDPGIKNFAIYKELIPLSELKEIEIVYSTGKTQRPPRNTQAYPNDDTLFEIFSRGSHVFSAVHSLIPKNEPANIPITNEMRQGLFKLFDKYKSEGFWDNVTHVVIEEQFINTRSSKKAQGTANMTAIKIAEIAYGWILYHYPTINISYLPSRKKYAICRCPLTFNKKCRTTGELESRKATKIDRKKWAATKGKEILVIRDEEDVVDSLEELKKTQKQKLDDIGDCIVQCQALKWVLMLQE